MSFSQIEGQQAIIWQKLFLCEKVTRFSHFKLVKGSQMSIAVLDAGNDFSIVVVAPAGGTSFSEDAGIPVISAMLE